MGRFLVPDSTRRVSECTSRRIVSFCISYLKAAGECTALRRVRKGDECNIAWLEGSRRQSYERHQLCGDRQDLRSGIMYDNLEFDTQESARPGLRGGCPGIGLMPLEGGYRGAWRDTDLEWDMFSVFSAGVTGDEGVVCRRMASVVTP